MNECVQHLRSVLEDKVPKGFPGAQDTKRPIAEFCKVQISSVTRWFSNTERLPVGEPRIRLMCYLDAVGYRVIELERLQHGRRGFVEIVGFGILSPEEAAKLIGFQRGQALLRVLRGSGSTSDAKDQQMWDIWKQHREELERRKAAVKPIMADATPKAQAQVVAVTAPDSSSSEMLGVRRKAMIHLVEGLQALLETSSFEDLSSNDAADAILRFSAYVSGLSSRLIQAQRKAGS